METSHRTIRSENASCRDPYMRRAGRLGVVRDTARYKARAPPRLNIGLADQHRILEGHPPIKTASVSSARHTTRRPPTGHRSAAEERFPQRDVTSKSPRVADPLSIRHERMRRASCASGLRSTMSDYMAVDMPPDSLEPAQSKEPHLPPPRNPSVPSKLADDNRDARAYNNAAAKDREPPRSEVRFTSAYVQRADPTTKNVEHPGNLDPTHTFPGFVHEQQADVDACGYTRHGILMEHEHYLDIGVVRSHMPTFYQDSSLQHAFLCSMSILPPAPAPLPRIRATRPADPFPFAPFPFNLFWEVNSARGQGHLVYGKNPSPKWDTFLAMLGRHAGCTAAAIHEVEADLRDTEFGTMQARLLSLTREEHWRQLQSLYRYQDWRYACVLHWVLAAYRRLFATYEQNGAEEIEIAEMRFPLPFQKPFFQEASETPGLGFCVTKARLGHEHILPHHPLYLALRNPSWPPPAGVEHPGWPRVIRSSVNPPTAPLPPRRQQASSPPRTVSQLGSLPAESPYIRDESPLSTVPLRAPPPPPLPPKPWELEEQEPAAPGMTTVLGPPPSWVEPEDIHHQDGFPIVFVVPQPPVGGEFTQYQFVPTNPEPEQIHWPYRTPATPASSGPLPLPMSDGTVIMEERHRLSMIDRAIEAGRRIELCPDVGPLIPALTALLDRLVASRPIACHIRLPDVLAKRLSKFIDWTQRLERKLRNGRCHIWYPHEIEHISNFFARIEGGLEDLRPEWEPRRPVPQDAPRPQGDAWWQHTCRNGYSRDSASSERSSRA